MGEITPPNEGNVGSQKSNMTVENPPFEDVFPIEHRDFPIVMLVFRGVIH